MSKGRAGIGIEWVYGGVWLRVYGLKNVLLCLECFKTVYYSSIFILTAYI